MSFSLKWFMSEKAKEQEALKVEQQKLINQQQKLTNKLLEKQLEGKEEEPIAKPYKSIKLVGNILTVVLNDGAILSKSDCSVTDFSTIRSFSSEKEIIKFLSSEKGKEKVNEEDISVMSDDFNVLLNTGLFEEKDFSMYLKGIDRSLPPLLVNHFSHVVRRCITEEINVEDDGEFIALKRFFMWCCLNPRADVADLLYDFLKRNRMKITRQGFFIALRNVVEVKGDKDSDIVEFISNAYNKVKGVWKKDPAKYEVYKHAGEYCIHPTKESSDAYAGEWIGNLKDLYIDLPNMKENRFTDNWTRTFDIRIGRVVSMPKEDCNWSRKDCAAAGLHFAGHTAPYVLCGDTTVFVLINPMTVVGIGEEKGRCYEYLPFMTTNIEEADEIMNSNQFDFLQLDEQYAIDSLTSLEDKVKDGFAKEATKHVINLSHISTEMIHTISSYLSAMKDEIKDRVKKV